MLARSSAAAMIELACCIIIIIAVVISIITPMKTIIIIYKFDLPPEKEPRTRLGFNPFPRRNLTRRSHCLYTPIYSVRVIALHWRRRKIEIFRYRGSLYLFIFVKDLPSRTILSTHSWVEKYITTAYSTFKLKRFSTFFICAYYIIALVLHNISPQTFIPTTAL